MRFTLRALTDTDACAEWRSSTEARAGVVVGWLLVVERRVALQARYLDKRCVVEISVVVGVGSAEASWLITV